ncbi:TonB-dependent receptor [Nitrosococcus halophilus Nc 4]|uniref:TonB-dependent receptor n=1 Tax=Nitrosococcus halophilus (strain Nc4) TaxID=472759 RepID=D5C2J6_NITHN|nr:TonB-dependent receptor [Nitrosococcus halophilus]ADE14855.1 TonB-dependent receptor [Nitrosococcus halophilus Nc 4]
MWRIQGWYSGECFLGLAAISPLSYKTIREGNAFSATRGRTSLQSYATVRWLVHCSFTLGVLGILLGVQGQTMAAETGEDNLKLPGIEVRAVRQGGALDTLSRNVTRITREEIEKQQETTQSVAEILGRMVPGMAPASQTFTNFNQTLRGRDVLVLIDGVPMNTNRNISRDLFNIKASAIESIEVVNGGSSVYGGGAAGGIIHINTLQGRRTEGVEFETVLGGSSSLTELDDEALSGRLTQKVLGKTGPVDYTFSFSGEQTQGFFDAEGDRIPPEPSQGDLSDTGTLDVLGKLGYEFGADQRLELTASYFDQEQDTDFISDPAVNDFPPGSVKARAVKGLQLDEQTANENLFLNLGYTKKDLLGSKIQAQAYYRDYHSRFFPFDGRPFSGWNALAQTFLDSQVSGGRLTIDTPFSPLEGVDAFLLWGADLNHEETEQPATIFNGDVFDASGGRVFEVTDKERTFVPETTTESYGVFGQLEVIPLDQVILRGGIRHEWVDVSFDGFVTLGQRNEIEGGEIHYSETTFNAGVVYTPVSPLDLYFNFSQSFELPDIGLQLRFAPEGFDVSDSNLEPRITDNFEVGVRGRFGGLRVSAAGFYSESDLGRVFVENFSLVQERTPEHIYGAEGSLDYAFSDRLKIGGTFTWQEGEREDPATGEDIALNGFRISPLKLTGYAEYSPFYWWNARLQVLYSGNRDDAAEDGVGFGGREVEDYTVVDLYSSFDAGPGTLRIGIENLLNNQYQTVFGQLLRNGRNTSNIAARGATARVSYTLRW